MDFAGATLIAESIREQIKGKTRVRRRLPGGFGHIISIIEAVLQGALAPVGLADGYLTLALA